MPFERQRSPLLLSSDDRQKLERIQSSRTEPHARVIRARILLAYIENEAINSIARRLNISRPRVERCVDKALSGGIEMGLSELRRPGRPPDIKAEDKAWVINLACAKPKELGYPHEIWTISLLAQHVRQNAVSSNHPALQRAGKSHIHNILKEMPIHPHKVSYYLERKDPDFDEKMAQVLVVYKTVQLINEEEANSDKDESNRKWAVICYDEKPGIQAIENTAPDLPPVPGKHPAVSRDYEYKRHGTISLLAGIDLHAGSIIALTRERHRSCEFIEFLELLDEKYPPDWKLRIILDNHSSHTSRETMKALKRFPNRFEFIFTPKHGSWLNLIEMFFSKMARTFLRHLRVSSKEELKGRLAQYIDGVNKEPVVFQWKYKMDEVLV
jgi:transposase